MVERVQEGQFSFGKTQCPSCHVCGQVVGVAGAGDGDHMRSAVQSPGQPDLRRGHPMSPGDSTDLGSGCAIRVGLVRAENLVQRFDQQSCPPSLWVPNMLSWPLTWCSPARPGSQSPASSCGELSSAAL